MYSRLAGTVLALMLAIPLAAALVPRPVAAQAEPEFFERPYAPNQWTYGRRLDQSEFRYCVDPRDPAWNVDGAIADAVAQGLLLQPKRYVVQDKIIVEDITKAYSIMLAHCDAYMGFKLIPDAYASWATLTRAYYRTDYVFVTADPDVHALADIPPGRSIGATIGTLAHIRLVSYLMGLPSEKRWSAFPMGTNELALQMLRDGRTDAALVWAPSLWAVQQNDPSYAKLHPIAPEPLPPTALGVGMLMLSNETFLRTAVDEAIAALTADGTIADILQKYGFPATAKP